MPTSSRLRGNINPIFTIKVGATAATSYADDTKKISLDHVDKPDDDITFYEAAQGTAVDGVLKVTTVASFDATALYGFLWDNAGKDVEIIWGPWGNATPSATKPHFKLAATLPNRPGLETEARRTPEGASAEVEIQCSGPAIKVTA